MNQPTDTLNQVQKTEANGGVRATKNLGGRAEIRIRDNGSGIPPEVRGEDIQSVLYDQACWRRDRVWPVHQSRHRRQATWRVY
jgi:hypothetical protein